VTKFIRPSPMKAGYGIWRKHFADAQVILLAGSVIRGEGTPSSDLDIVVIQKRLPAAYRRSFVYEGWPVEAFVHDPQTLNYFCWELDRRSGIPTLPSMVIEGKAIPRENKVSRSLKLLAQEVLAAGPPKWSEADIARARYTITNLCDDIRAPRNHAELTGSASSLYDVLADFYFRAAGRWSAKGKSVPRKLAEADSVLARRFIKAFQVASSTHRTSLLLQLAEVILKPYGGWLFDGYRVDAPSKWRKPFRKRHVTR
jgi:predicted nucleotidyltransferase